MELIFCLQKPCSFVLLYKSCFFLLGFVNVRTKVIVQNTPLRFENVNLICLVYGALGVPSHAFAHTIINKY